MTHSQDVGDIRSVRCLELDQKTRLTTTWSAQVCYITSANEEWIQQLVISIATLVYFNFLQIILILKQRPAESNEPTLFISDILTFSLCSDFDQCCTGLNGFQVACCFYVWFSYRTKLIFWIFLSLDC